MRWFDRLPWRRRGAPGAGVTVNEPAGAAGAGDWEPTPDAECRKTEADQLFDANRIPEAGAAYRALLDRYPNYGRAWNNLGLCLRVSGRLAEAHDAFVRASSHSPGLPAVWVNLAAMQEERGVPDRALESLQRALAIDPTYREALNNAAQLLATLGRFRAAESLFRNGLVRYADDAGLHFNLGLTLARQARIDEALAELRTAVERDLATPSTGSGYLMALNYSDRLEPSWVRQEHERLVLSWARSSVADAPIRRSGRSGPLRVGYVSPDFGYHVISFFIEPVLAAHDRSRVEPICYFSGEREDAQCERIKRRGVGWRHLAGLDASAVAQEMRKDELDVVVDLAGHTGGHLLHVLAARVAPVQVTWLGYPNTTGVPAMDYRLTDQVADPPGMTDAFHSETLYRLDRAFLVYQPRPEAPPVGPPPVLSRGWVTFASFNNFAKVSPTTLTLWARILSRVPGARLLVKSKGLDEPDLARDVRQRFGDLGGDAARLDLEGQQPGFDQHLARYGDVDIALDSFPYGGTTTTCEALWMGVPVVSLAGRVHAARVGASLLTQVGHPEWIASTAERYVDIAVALAEDPAALARFRRALRNEMRESALTDPADFTRRLETAFEHMVAAAPQGGPSDGPISPGQASSPSRP
ncbi:MAG: tetratricopeptide repeat protein [Burkholderiales bacterium]